MTDSQTPNQPDPRGEAYVQALDRFHTDGDIQLLEEYHLRQIRWLRYAQRVINWRGAEITDQDREKMQAQVALEVTLPAAHSRPVQRDHVLIRARADTAKVLKAAGTEDFFGDIASAILLHLIDSQSVILADYTYRAVDELARAFFYTAQANFGGNETFEEIPRDAKDGFRTRAVKLLSSGDDL
jgi:hypothetical protein